MEGVGTWDRAPVLTLPLPADPTCPTPATIRATSFPLSELRRGTCHLAASGALCWAKRGRRAEHGGLWLCWLWARQWLPLLFPNESQGKGCFLGHRFLASPQLSLHIETNRSPPPTTGLASKCISAAVRAITYSVPATMLNTWILFYGVKHDYHPILQMIL